MEPDLDELLGPKTWPIRPTEITDMRLVIWLWLTKPKMRKVVPKWVIAVSVGMPVRKKWRHAMGWRW